MAVTWQGRVKVTKANNDHRMPFAKVNALFLDYDGTIAPLDVPLSESKVSAGKLAVLEKINSRIPVAIISTKDLPFLISRVPFIRGWSALGGLETRIGEVISTSACLQEKASSLMKALVCARRASSSVSGILLEEKRDSTGRIAAFSVDWRQASNFRLVEKQVSRIFAYCEKLPITTNRSVDQPFFDVFPCPIDKGKALAELKKKLGVANGVLYLGDSSVDNSAFEAADMGVGVISRGSGADLSSDYLVKFGDVEGFLNDLLRNGLRFRTDASMICLNSQAKRPSTKSEEK